MLLHTQMAKSGAWLFSRRGWFLLMFLPILILAFPREAWTERTFGDAIGDGYKAFCLALIVGGLAIRALAVGFVPGRSSVRNVGVQADLRQLAAAATLFLGIETLRRGMSLLKAPGR